MNKDPASLRQDAFNFIDELERLSDSDSILDALQRVLAPFGFGRVVMSGLTLKPGQVFDDIVLASRWPHEFQAIYSARDYLRISPIVRLAIRSPHPFEWDEATWRKDEDPRAIDLMELAADPTCRADPSCPSMAQPEPGRSWRCRASTSIWPTPIPSRSFT